MPKSNASLLDLACTATELGDGWNDGDTGEAVSTSETNTPAASPVATNWSFDTNTSADTNDLASRNKDIGSIEGLGTRVVISFRIYCDLLGDNADVDYFQLQVRRSDWRFRVCCAADGLFIYDASAWAEVETNIVIQDAWQTWTFDIDLSGGIGSAVCDVWLGDDLQASGVDCDYETAGTDGDVYIFQHGNTNDNRLSYLDWLKIGDGFAPTGALFFGSSF